MSAGVRFYIAKLRHISDNNLYERLFRQVDCALRKLSLNKLE